MVEPDAQIKLSRPSEVRAWLAARNFLPSKVLGQNFLIDENILNIILGAAELNPADRVLEIGPGLGMLTVPLLERVEHVTAVEKDKRLAGHLAERFTSATHFSLMVSDVLDLSLAGIQSAARLNKLIANLPYSVASRLLVECFLLNEGFDRIVVTVQLEVAERLAAPVNTRDYGLLTIWAQLDYDVKITKRISPGCFYPRPQVTSAIVVMKKKNTRRAHLKNARLFDALIKGAFSQRRKQLGTILNNLVLPGQTKSGAQALDAAGLDPKRRPETLTVDEWIALAHHL